MTDFSKPYRNVPFFGLWADETADDYGKRDAMEALRAAVMRCYDEDARTLEVSAALDYLVANGAKAALARNFRLALDLPDSNARVVAARATYEAFAAALGQR